MNCIECGFSHRDGKWCRNCMHRSAYVSKDNIPACCEGCDLLTKDGECTLFCGDKGGGTNASEEKGNAGK